MVASLDQRATGRLLREARVMDLVVSSVPAVRKALSVLAPVWAT